MISGQRVCVCVGLVTQLPEDFYTFMLELQGKLANLIKSVGKIEHALYPFMIHFVVITSLYRNLMQAAKD